TLSAFDFFCIVIWKANRAKSKVAARMRAKGHPSLAAAVDALLRGIGSAADNRGRLGVVGEGWGFRLPHASAFLTRLSPECLTVSDVRVCEVLSDCGVFEYRTQVASLRRRYSEYIEAVRAAVHGQPALRDKDRYLWGRSFADQLDRDTAAGFQRPAVDEEPEA